jgi:ABC-type branched-subunit amino acid transport system ATPase component
MNKTVLECNGIAAGYVKDLNILQGVDLVVKEKEIVSIIGPNGAGKSTLLKAIMGLNKYIRWKVLYKWYRKN